MILYVKFIRVTGKAHPQPGYTKDLLTNALYDSARILEYVEGGDNEFVANVRVETAESEARLDFLANYQAGRLNSFHNILAKVYDNPDEIANEFGSFHLTA